MVKVVKFPYKTGMQLGLPPRVDQRSISSLGSLALPAHLFLGWGRKVVWCL